MNYGSKVCGNVPSQRHFFSSITKPLGSLAITVAFACSLASAQQVCVSVNGVASDQKIRVLGFSPAVNGLHFDNNSWPPRVDFNLKILGQTLHAGSPDKGLCGGMAYTVRDCWDRGVLPPTDQVKPAEGTPLFNYIAARLAQTYDENDVNQYLSWIQMEDHDTVLGAGLPHP